MSKPPRAGQTSLFDLATGEAEKRRGLDRIQESHDGFVRTLRAAAIDHSRLHGKVTADDVRRLAMARGLRPQHKNAWGAIFRGRGWKRVGESKSELATNHGHRNPVWRYETI